MYTTEYYLAIKSKEMKLSHKWMEPQNVLSEVFKTEKDKYAVFFLIGGF